MVRSGTSRFVTSSTDLHEDACVRMPQVCLHVSKWLNEERSFMMAIALSLHKTRSTSLRFPFSPPPPVSCGWRDGLCYKTHLSWVGCLGLGLLVGVSTHQLRNMTFSFGAWSIKRLFGAWTSVTLSHSTEHSGKVSLSVNHHPVAIISGINVCWSHHASVR